MISTTHIAIQYIAVFVLQLVFTYYVGKTTNRHFLRLSRRGNLLLFIAMVYLLFNVWWTGQSTLWLVELWRSL